MGQGVAMKLFPCSLSSAGGGEGDRSQGCTDPRGRTLREDRIASIAGGRDVRVTGL